MRSGWLTVIKHTINPLAIRAARRGSGPFSLVEHVGRKSGKRYETPIIVAPVDAGFVAELTYGPSVAWYQNSRAAGGCVVRYHGRPFTIDRIAELDAEAGLRAYRYLVYLGASQMVQAHFPELRAQLGEEPWRTLIEGFVRQSAWRSHFYGDLRHEFLDYLARASV